MHLYFFIMLKNVIFIFISNEGARNYFQQIDTLIRNMVTVWLHLIIIYIGDDSTQDSPFSIAFQLFSSTLFLPLRVTSCMLHFKSTLSIKGIYCIIIIPQIAISSMSHHHHHNHQPDKDTSYITHIPSSFQK